ncbi:MAG: 16S rRNA (cytosine(1402)-N(4))-methyltransferase RsmH [Bryobacteraceae bacterium]|nr:16S rRNA (cytosine(1402)-N(4))-methyltransferase RsmH [Bryobacteraceae bacterium]
MQHVPVMTAEVLQWLAPREGGVYLDATCGLGSHTKAIAAHVGAGGLVVSNDRDAESLAMARASVTEQAERIQFTQGPFSSLADRWKAMGRGLANGLVADLGVSRYQLTTPERGMTFMADGPLDMRMDRSQGETAADVCNHSSELELANLIYEYGEERRSRQIARAIAQGRPVTTTGQLCRLITQVTPRTSRTIAPETKTFQALRIAVNHELDEIKALLNALPELVGPGGRVVTISFHSLEDRILKQHFQALGRSGQARVLTKHVVAPSNEEVRRNPPSRSAKLRCVEMMTGEE